jgi:bifunctional polynucleotide phosphatase/kinase
MDKIAIPIQIYASMGDGKARKPAIGMWELFLSTGNGGVEPDLSQSKYVGDAAGREKNWAAGKKKDFSDSDRKFAINLGISFQTPEEFFLGQKPVAFTLHGADPKLIKKDGPLYEPTTAKLVAGHQEIVITVGYPASGKSFFTVNELEKKGGYVRVNRDTLKTKEKCWKVAEEALDQGKSVCIDNTNPDIASRAPYIKMAKERKIPVRAFVMQTTYDEAMHNNQFREIITGGGSPHVPTMVYNMFRKNYEEPTLKEGFNEIVKTHFRPSFNDPETEKIYYMWTPL